MKTTVYFFSFDTASGMDSDLFATPAEMLERLHETVAEYDSSEIADNMRKLPFDSELWCKYWEAFKDRQTDQRNYFNYGSQELEISAPCATSYHVETTRTPGKPHTWQPLQRGPFRAAGFTCEQEETAQEVIWGERLADSLKKLKRPRHFRIIKHATTTEEIPLRYNPNK